jgi:hypothetical protein
VGLGAGDGFGFGVAGVGVGVGAVLELTLPQPMRNAIIKRPRTNTLQAGINFFIQFSPPGDKIGVLLDKNALICGGLAA